MYSRNDLSFESCFFFFLGGGGAARPVGTVCLAIYLVWKISFRLLG